MWDESEMPGPGGQGEGRPTWGRGPNWFRPGLPDDAAPLRAEAAQPRGAGGSGFAPAAG